MAAGKGRVRATATVLVGLCLLGGVLGGVAGCGSSSADESSARSIGPAAKPEAAPPELTTGGADAAGGGAAKEGTAGGKAAPPTLPASDVQRSIIYQGSITVRVSDVNVAATRAAAIATGDGGYVGGDQRTIDAQASVATVTLRIPAAQFTPALAALSALGHEQSRQVSTQDVTEQVVDVQSRIKTQQASVDRIRALLAKATSISEIESIESELTTREADLESMEAQMRSLTDLTSLSTITATLLGPEARVVTAPVKHTGFVAGLRSGWHTFLDSLRVLLTAIGAILPFAVVIGAVLWAIFWLLRRRRRASATEPAPPGH